MSVSTSRGRDLLLYCSVFGNVLEIWSKLVKNPIVGFSNMGNEMKSVMRVWLKMFILGFLQAASCENIYASEKSVVMLPCDGKPQTQVAWSYKKDASSAYTNIVKIVGRNTLFVVPEHPGPYLQSSSLKLDCLVTGSSGIQADPSSGTLSVKNGGSVFFPCELSSSLTEPQYQSENVSWSRVTQESPAEQEILKKLKNRLLLSSKGNHSIRLSKVSPADAGKYTCLVQISGAKMRKSFQLNVLSVESRGVNGVCCLHGNASGFHMEWSNAEGQARDLQIQQGESKTTLTLPMAQMNSTAWKCNLYLGSKLQTSIDYTPGIAGKHSTLLQSEAKVKHSSHAHNVFIVYSSVHIY
ncbi:UNVERIFIED_CONTAM: hypothetical protein FKN15_015723 [Acipenser sinensis]